LANRLAKCSAFCYFQAEVVQKLRFLNNSIDGMRDFANASVRFNKNRFWALDRGIWGLQGHGLPGNPMGGRYPGQRRYVCPAREKGAEKEITFNLIILIDLCLFVKDAACAAIPLK
jgi:hypothetical protein